MKVNVYDRTGKVIEEIELAENVFGVPVKESTVHEVISMYLANGRVGTASTKTRGEVQGSGRKPWRQKHTGRARAGSIRSPLWRGGGIIFGPKPRDYAYSIPRKVRRKALQIILTEKANAGEIIVLDRGEDISPKTKEMADILKKLAVVGKVLLVVEEANESLDRSTRNLENVGVALYQNLNAYDLLCANRIIFSRQAILKLQEALSSGRFLMGDQKSDHN